MMLRRKKNNLGFSLIELLVVFSIIAVLTGIVLYEAARARSVSRDGQRASDVSRIGTALGIYFADNKSYPPTLSSLVPTYMSDLPTDPSTGNSYVYAGINLSGPQSSCETYHIGAVMENAGFSGLAQDKDAPANASVCTGSGPDFDGNAVNCSGNSASSPDQCFDISP